MPSERNDIADVTAVVNVIKSELQVLGFTTATFANPTMDPKTSKPISADILVGEIAGKKKQYINFVVHADTVFKSLPTGEVPVPYKIVNSAMEPTPVAISGKRIIGSGVGDDKGGVVVALRAIKMLLAKGTPEYSLRVIVSANEEFGSPGHQITLATFAKDAVAVLGMEPSGLGHVLYARGGVHNYEITVTGVEGHAGVAHERGVNAYRRFTHRERVHHLGYHAFESARARAHRFGFEYSMMESSPVRRRASE